MAYSWRKLEDLFEQAFKMKPDELAAFLSEIESTDAELSEVLKLMIDAALKDGDYMYALQHKMAKSTLENERKVLDEGSILGKFKITERIGKGGMGEVYLAERADGDLQQSVAIKLLHHSIDNQIDNLSFKNEQQILAQLKHPYIAQIYDVGVTDSNQPYFVMEYVEGEPIDKYCQKHKLSFKERIKIFKKVCEAVAYAHKNLILHQDIKPENILVSKEGYIKLLDFGIAKFISQKQTPQSTNFAGSPYYASPEQLQAKYVSTSSDVYQLGILMFKLLTDELPFELKREDDFITRAYDEPIVAPSLSTEKFFRQRKLRGELDAIILKALKSNAAERYQNVPELLDEIDRYEKKLPVAAIGKKSGYRLRKYLIRNKFTVFTLALIITILSASSYISYQQYMEAEKARKIAENTSTFMKELFTSANPYLNAERDYKKFSVFEFLEEKREKLLNDDQLTNEMRWEMLKIIYTTYRNLTIDDISIEVAEKMLDMAQEQNNFLWETEAIFYIGKAYAMNYMFEKSAPYFEKVYEQLSTLEKSNPVLAASLLKEVGLSVHLSGNYDSAENMYQRAIQTFEKYGKENDEEAILTYGNYAQLLRVKGDLKKAINLASLAIEKQKNTYDENDINMARNYGDRALIFMEMTDYENSEKDFEKAIGINLQHLDSSNQFFQIMAGNYAIMLMLEGNMKKAKALNAYLYNHAVEKHGYENMNTVYAQIQYGENLLHLNRLDEAKNMLETAVSNASKLLPEGHTFMGMLYALSAQIYNEMKMYEEGKKVSTLALEIFENRLPSGHYRIGLAKMRQLYARAALGDELAENELIAIGEELLKQDRWHHLYRLEIQKYLENNPMS